MRVLLPTLLLATACHGTGDGSDPFADDVPFPGARVAAAPPSGGLGALGLEVSGAVIGEKLTFTVTGVDPGEDVVLVRGERSVTGGTCLAAIGGQCLEVDDPHILASITANAAGEAGMSVTTPNRPDTETCFQAVVRRGAGGVDSVFSHASCRNFGDDADDDGIVDADDLCPNDGDDHCLGDPFAQLTFVRDKQDDDTLSAECPLGEVIAFGFFAQTSDEHPGGTCADTGFGHCGQGMDACSWSRAAPPAATTRGTWCSRAPTRPTCRSGRAPWSRAGPTASPARSASASPSASPCT